MSAVPTTVIVHFHAKPGRQRELREALMTAMPHLGDLPGCRGGSLYNDVEAPDLFVLVEHWESTAHHKAYIQQIEGDGTMAALQPLLAKPVERRYLSGTK